MINKESFCSNLNSAMSTLNQMAESWQKSLIG